jgi:hypothetical protein
MEKTNVVGETALDLGKDLDGIEAGPKASELRALDDLELMLAGGGDVVVCW